MKRFYKTVEVAEQGGRFHVLLDGRPVKTPAQTPLSVATRPLAQAIADEWEAQQGEIKPLAMPLTRLAATVLDRAEAQRAAFQDEILAYLGNDLVCYRTEAPPDLAERQRTAWDAWLDWAAGHGIRLEPTTGVLHQPQAPESIAAGRRLLEEEDPLGITVAYVLTTTLGSAVLALAVLKGDLDAERAFSAALVDELFQAEKWGEDREAVRARREVVEDVRAAARFLDLARGR